MPGDVSDILLDESGLTPKQQSFVQQFVENGGNGVQAALVAYDTDSPGTAGVIAHRLLRKDNIRSVILSTMDELNITPKTILRTLADGLHANTVIVSNMGDIVGEKPDHVVRHKYLDTALKLLDAFPDRELHVKKQSISMQVHDNPELMRYIAQHGKRPASESQVPGETDE